MAALIATDPTGRRWQLDIEHDDDGDGFNYAEHVAVALDNGDRQYLDWSRFRGFEDAHFVAFVAAGFPRRPSVSPWYPNEIEQLPEFAGTQIGEAA